MTHDEYLRKDAELETEQDELSNRVLEIIQEREALAGSMGYDLYLEALAQKRLSGRSLDPTEQVYMYEVHADLKGLMPDTRAEYERRYPGEVQRHANP